MMSQDPLLFLENLNHSSKIVFHKEYYEIAELFILSKNNLLTKG